MSNVLTCTACGSTDFDPGFIDDAATGRVRWFLGAMKIGIFGNAKRSGPKWTILAYRCRQCSRLQLFAGDPA